MKSKAWIIFRMVIGFILNLLSVVSIPFFVMGIPMSIQLDMGEYVWVWVTAAAFFVILLILSILMLRKAKKDWEFVNKTNP